MYHKLQPQQHQELVYSKQELVEKKDITQFLTKNNIKFDELGNVYRDYQAYIKINNLQNKQKVKVKPYIPPLQEKPKPKKIKRPISASPTKKPKKEKQKKSSKKTTKQSEEDQAEYYSLAPRIVDHHQQQVQDSHPEATSSYISAPMPKLEEVVNSSHHHDEESQINYISENAAPQQQQQEDVVDIVVPSVIRELIFFIQNKKDDPQLNVQDAIKSICLSHIQRYSLNQEQSVRAINRVMQDFGTMMKNVSNEKASQKESENWSRTPRLGSMKSPSEDPDEAKRIELNEYLDEFISHNEEESHSKKRPPPPFKEEIGEYVSEIEQEEEDSKIDHSKSESKIKSNNNVAAGSKSSYSSQNRINNFSKTKSKSSFRSGQVQDENNTGRSEKTRSISAKSKTPTTPVKTKKNSRSPQWRYTSPDDYVSVEKKKSAANSKSPSPVKVQKQRRQVSELPKGQHWNEKTEFDKRVLLTYQSGSIPNNYHSPIKREVRKKFDDYERLSKLKMSQLNNSLGEKLSTTMDGFLRTKSPSPMTNRSFVYKSGPPEVEQNKLGRKRLNEEWYNEQSRKVFQDRVDNMEKQFSKFLPNKAATTISCDKLGSSDKVKFYKMLLQRSKLQTVENYRKIPPTVPK